MASETWDHRRRRDGLAPPPEKPAGGAGGAPGSAPADVVVPFRWLILLGLLTAAIMEILDTTIINVALPKMAGNLNATTDEIAWVATGYILSNVIVLPMTAWLARRFGRKRYLMTSILIFIISSFLCGTSHTLGELVFWRILQGAGGAALISTAQGTIVQIFPRSMQGMVQAIFGLGLVVAPTIGPTIGGYITDNYDWPWIFFINVPIGLTAIALVGAFLQDPPLPKIKTPVDWLGIILLASGLGSLQYVLEEGQRNDWFADVWILRLSILAVVALVGFVVWQLSKSNKAPVVDLRVLQNKSLTSGILIGLALGFGLYGGIFIFPLFTQNVLGFTPTATGLVLLPGGVATGICVIICGRVLQRGVDPRILVSIGILVYMLSMWQLGHLTTQSGEPDTRLALIIRGVGLGFMFIPITVAAYSGLKGSQIQQGAALFNLSRQLGGSFGIAVLSTYVTNMTVYHRYNLVANFYSGNPLFEQRQAALSAHLIASGYGANAAHSAAVGSLSGMVQAQAYTMAYNDAFILLGLTFVVAFPAVLFLKRQKGGSQAPGGH